MSLPGDIPPLMPVLQERREYSVVDVCNNPVLAAEKSVGTVHFSQTVGRKPIIEDDVANATAAVLQCAHHTT